MLRIYFTSEDIARTRMASVHDPLWELVLSVHMLRGQRGDLLYTDWRRSTANILRSAQIGSGVSLLSALTPTMGYFPDFLNPVVDSSGDQLEAGLEEIRRTPIAALRRDLERMAVPHTIEPSLRQIAEGDPAALRELTTVMRAYYEIAVGPHRRTVDAAIEHDRAVRVHEMALKGVEGLLHSLRPLVEYSDGELRVPSHPDQEIRLSGRGLLLVPSYFCINHPVTMFDENLTPVLVYPVERRHDLLPEPQADRRQGLAALIGPTRAAVLAAVLEGRTTTDLARRVGISPGSASEQAAVLREAGLIVSRRDRNRMIHQLTPLGMAILNSRG
jgi:DNA-binding transcriptional ArsR family regulator